MTVAFFSNFLNHHQLPLCLAWHKELGADFTFVAMQPFDGSEVAASYTDMNQAHAFCLAAYESEKAAAQARRLANESDVVLYGATPPALFHTRIAMGKLTFRYSERIFKPYYTKSMAYTYCCAVWECLRYARQKNTWLLAAGAYAAQDYGRAGGFRGRALRWGYFPDVPLASPRQQESAVLRLLWAGRMISYKHAERAMPLLQALQAQKIAFVFTLAGDGPLREALKELYAPFGACVQFAGTQSVPQTRALMRHSDIFLFTSDESEGWGAVLSEAMADGCAVLASDACGASAYLIESGENGVLFADSSQDDLVQKGLALAHNCTQQRKMGQAAAHTMRSTWNASVAANRFLQTSRALLEGKPLVHWPDGPCSKDACLALPKRRKV